MQKNAVATSFAIKCRQTSTHIKTNVSPFRIFKDIKNNDGNILKISVSILPTILDLIDRNPFDLTEQIIFFVNNRYYILLYTDIEGIATCQNLQTGQKTIFHVLKVVHVCLVLDAPIQKSKMQLSFFE